jgi:hypothetical protein
MEQEQEFVRQLRFRFVDLAGSLGSGRAFAHRNNPSTQAVVTWSVDWARSAWDANNWAFAQGLFRGREFFVPRESVCPAEGEPWQFGATFRVADEWVGRFAEMFAERHDPSISQLVPELARVDQAKWHGQIEGL